LNCRIPVFPAIVHVISSKAAIQLHHHTVWTSPMINISVQQKITSIKLSFNSVKLGNVVYLHWVHSHPWCVIVCLRASMARPGLADSISWGALFMSARAFGLDYVMIHGKS
jgi:hypothetical protein